LEEAAIPAKALLLAYHDGSCQLILDKRHPQPQRSRDLLFAVLKLCFSFDQHFPGRNSVFEAPYGNGLSWLGSFRFPTGQPVGPC